MSRPKYTIILSIDSLSSSDFQLISMLPNFKKYIKDAAVCDNVTSVYPTLTCPAHVTMMTGKYPLHHGIINDTLFTPSGEDAERDFNDSLIKCKTLYGEASNKGMKVTSILWPVKDKYLKDFVQPERDEFVKESLKDNILNHKSNLVLTHFTALDASRHQCGYAAPDVFRAMERLDQYLGEIFEVLESENILGDTTLIILGSHSQIDVHTAVSLNERFEKDGYIVRDGHMLKYWEICAHPCGGSCYIYMKNPDNKERYEQIYEYLCTLQGEKQNGISGVYTHDEAEQFGADDKCSFMIEARIGYYFTNSCFNLKAAHGYLPTIQEYQTLFMAYGKGIKKNASISNISLVDVAPTIAKLLDIDLEDTDGIVLDEILDI
jgi:predicted AlkP superfamily pyrophosphatase or phosphodiesterase